MHSGARSTMDAIRSLNKLKVILGRIAQEQEEVKKRDVAEADHFWILSLYVA